MKFKIDSGSMAIAGIALTSLISAGAITGLESFLANREKKEPVIKVIKVTQVYTRQFFLGETKYSSSVPEVYAIKPEEDVFVRDWRDYSVRTNSKFG